jgi:hypothetical protein
MALVSSGMRRTVAAALSLPMVAVTLTTVGFATLVGGV